MTSALLRAVWMRGGTSKCWLFAESALPDRRTDRDEILVDAFGSASVRQLDGVGGGTSTTSKAVVVRDRAVRAGYVPYEFGQIAVDAPRVEWSSNCGNCATGLGLYAIEMGWAVRTDSAHSVRLANILTGLEVQIRSPIATTNGLADAALGVERVISIEFDASSWTSPGRELLPTGSRVERLEVGGVTATATMIDAGTPAVFIDGRSLGVEADSGVDELRLRSLVGALRDARRVAAMRFGIHDSDGDAVPKVGVIGRATRGGPADISVRMLSMSEIHPAIGLTSAVALAAASTIPHTVVSEAIEAVGSKPRERLRIATGSGVVDARLGYTQAGTLAGVEFVRSARRIAIADVCVPTYARC